MIGSIVAITYDESNSQHYIQFRVGKVSKTISVGCEVFVDFDHKGQLLGIEVIPA